MQRIDRQTAEALVAASHIRPRLRRELKYKLDVVEWEASDFLVLTTPAEDRGVILVPQPEGYAVAEFEGRRRTKSGSNGRTKAAICDLCYTWRSGGAIATISFPLDKGNRTVGILACLDLRCSLHVRGLTDVARLSRAQLPENLTVEQRILRLNSKLDALMQQIHAEVIQVPQ